MAKAAWRILALSALVGLSAPAAHAQVVVGGDSRPAVVVNWGVLERLGRDPNLASMLLVSPSPTDGLQVSPVPQKKNVVFRPFKEAKPAKPVAPKVKKAAAPAPAPKAQPAPKVEPSPLAELVKAATESTAQPVPAAPAAKPAAVPPTAKPSLPPKAEIAEIPPGPAAKPHGPQVSLPEATPAAKLETVAKVEGPAPAAVAPSPVPATAPVAVAKPVEKPAPAPVQLAPQPAPVSEPAPAAKPAPAPVVAQPVPATAPMPLAALTPPPPAPAPQVAAVAPTAPVSSLSGDTLTLRYAGEDYRLPDTAKFDLTALAKKLEADEGLGLQLLAYASGDEASASKARRLSLSRAIEVRKFLLDRGIRSTRIEMRALGNRYEGKGSPDRVDAVLVVR
jgi:outer membrane protein OmpA-like peptidoglycan-associated protein